MDFVIFLSATCSPLHRPEQIRLLGQSCELKGCRLAAVDRGTGKQLRTPTAAKSEPLTFRCWREGRALCFEFWPLDLGDENCRHASCRRRGARGSEFQGGAHAHMHTRLVQKMMPGITDRGPMKDPATVKPIITHLLLSAWAGVSAAFVSLGFEFWPGCSGMLGVFVQGNKGSKKDLNSGPSRTIPHVHDVQNSKPQANKRNHARQTH